MPGIERDLTWRGLVIKGGREVPGCILNEEWGSVTAWHERCARWMGCKDSLLLESVRIVSRCSGFGIFGSSCKTVNGYCCA
eukprot:5271317-Amphidinium_carterae.3